jgi:Zn-dependent M28 family amino/carboxypeptidase
VSTLLAVADELRDDPPSGLRLLLVSTGAEESLMEGMEAFAERHFPSMPREATTVICIDTVGSPHLVLAEAEGMLEIRRHDEQLKELIAECARTNGLDLLRGMTMRFGTDGYVALRHGYRAATLMSVAASGAASNYHWPTDTPDRVSYGNVAAVVELCLGVVRRLADPKVPAPAFSA